MQQLAHQTRSFDDFTLDLTRGCLLRGAEEVKLRPKSFETLKYLIENHGRLVTKAELIEAVWPDTAVTDDSLVQCLMEVRRALGRDTQSYIKTVPRRGYIFEKEVRENDWAMMAGTIYTEEMEGVHVVIEEGEETNGHGTIATVKEPAVQTVAVATPRKASGTRRFAGVVYRHKRAAFACATLLVTVAALAYFFVPRKPPSIAVLPIVNATGDPNNDYISDGLTESVITSLTQINAPGKFPRLLVTAQNTVFIYKGRQVEPRGVGRELGVDTVLASKLTEQGGLWIVKTEMINVADGSEVWSKQYSVGVHRGDAFLAMQDELATDVAGKLPLSLSAAERQRLTRRYTQNAQAYDVYLKGRASFKTSTPAGFRKSIEYSQQAIDLDSNYALAYWLEGISYTLLGVAGEMPMKDADEKATDLYLKALKLDSTMSVVKGAMELQDMQHWNWEAIEKGGMQHAGYGFPNGGYLIAMGRLEEQLARENRILGWDPHSPFTNYSHAGTLYLARQYDAAIEQYHKTLNLYAGDKNEIDLGPESPWVHYSLGQVYVQKGMFPDAFTELNKAKDLLGDSPVAWEGLGYAYARSGQRDEALKILNQLQARANRGEYVLPLGVAWIYIGLGDKEQAFGWLDKAFDERADGLRPIKTHPIYDPLRSDPRFIDLLRRMKLPT